MHLEKQRRGLKSFPQSSEAKLVTSITASNNEIEFLPNITKYKNLKRLALNNNKIKNICASIYKLCKLNWLDLTRNNLRDLPIEMHKLNLFGLGLSENKFTEIPLPVFEMKNLQKFGFFSNFLTKIPINLFNLTELTKLDLSSNQLTEIPEEILNLKKLTWLNLSNNRLKKIPDLSSLEYLEELGLGNNSLTELPVLKNKNLKILPVYRNRLKSINLCLENIKKLDFSENCLEDVNIYAPKLSFLNLRNNKISDFKIYAHENCFTDLRENRLKFVPFKFFNLMKNTKYSENLFERSKKKLKFTHENSLKEICMNNKNVNTFYAHIKKGNESLIRSFVDMLYSKLKIHNLKRNRIILENEIISFSYRTTFYKKCNLLQELVFILNGHFNKNCMNIPNLERALQLLIDELCYAGLKNKQSYCINSNFIENQSIILQPLICEDFFEYKSTKLSKLFSEFHVIPNLSNTYFLFDFLNMQINAKSIELLNQISGFKGIGYKKSVRCNFCDSCKKIFYGKKVEKMVSFKYQNIFISVKISCCGLNCIKIFQMHKR